MNNYYEIDSNGYFIRDVLAEEQPANTVTVRPPNPCFKPRWDGAQWLEERPDPGSGKLWNADTKEWDIDPPEPEPDYAAFLAGLMEEMNDE